MNKKEKFIVILLGLVLAGWLWHSFNEQKKAVGQMAVASERTAETAPTTNLTADAAIQAKVAAPSPTAPSPVKPVVHAAPEKFAVLSNAQIAVTLSTRGAVAKAATLFQFAEKPGKISAENPALKLDFAAAPVMAVENLTWLAPDADYELVESDAEHAVFKNALMTRKITLKANYQLEVEDALTPAAMAAAKGDAVNRISLGCMTMGSSNNDLLSIDSMTAGDKPKALHHGEEEPLKSYLVGGAGGCGGKRSAEGIPETTNVPVPGTQAWVAVKNRFFVTALVKSSEANTGFTATMRRDMGKSDYLLKSVAAAVEFSAISEKRAFTFYLGPKKQSILWDLGMRDVMEYGMFRWFCYPMVWVLNKCTFGGVASYGIAIILLTFLVRIIFWPLTHKSTVGMRRMQELQPKLKALQAKFKSNPQRLQQETWQLYRTEKVNPMSSCLPMLVQIPVFIALFNVLRSSVELRYAPFLWIADLSEPEGLFASWFPFGGLNILPILMAATMALQSALTPSTGDKSQQRMMMVMMPIMMLFMFYSFPAALSLYWTLSQVLSIVQMWHIRRRYGTPEAKGEVIEPDAVEMPTTRQMRRHS